MNKQNSANPFASLGKYLKAMRTKAHESLAEVSGAVEIDAGDLARFELGQKRPSEDVLLLLISHFGARDDEALKLWEMAGYGTAKTPIVLASEPASPTQPILFTDIVDVVVNNYGVVMNFMQSAGPQTQPKSVARVGMSREHAKSVLEILQMTLSQTEHNHQPTKNPAKPDN